MGRIDGGGWGGGSQVSLRVLEKTHLGEGRSWECPAEHTVGSQQWMDGWRMNE